MVCLGYEPGPQDGRRRRNHGPFVCLFEKTENKLKRGRSDRGLEVLLKRLNCTRFTINKTYQINRLTFEQN